MHHAGEVYKRILNDPDKCKICILVQPSLELGLINVRYPSDAKGKGQHGQRCLLEINLDTERRIMSFVLSNVP